MIRRRVAACALAGCTTLLWGLVGCDQTTSNPNDNLRGNAPPGQPGAGSGPMGGGAAPASNSQIKEAMTKLAKGPSSLTSVIGNELKSESPPWVQLQTQTKEYVQMVTELAKYDPPKGTKESWIEQTGAYAKLATALNDAAQKKDADVALTVHGNITRLCMSCHREHRVMGPGGGGPGGGGFGRPGGGPPGGGYPGAGGGPQRGGSPSGDAPKG